MTALKGALNALEAETMPSKLPPGLTIRRELVSYVVSQSNGLRVAIAAPWEDSRGVFCILESAVAPHMRRRGIATMLYRHIEEVTGRQLSPAVSLSDDAFEFWKRYRPEAVANDLRHRKGELLGQKVLVLEKPLDGGVPATVLRASGGVATVLYDHATERAGSCKTLRSNELDAALLRAREAVEKVSSWMPPEGIDAQAAWQVSHELRIPPRAVADTILMSPSALAEVAADEGETNCLQVRDYPRLPLGSAGVRAAHGDPNGRYLCYLAQVASKDVMPTEAEADIRRHPSFEAYVQMLRDGHEPPYVSLFERPLEKLEAGQPRWTTSNRRRCLTAQEVGSTLTGWLSVDNHRTGLPLKVGDVKKAYEAAVERSTEYVSHDERSESVAQLRQRGG